MPLYEYRCRQCGATFESRRDAARADEDVRCPDGHDETVRLLSSFAAIGRAGAPAPPCGGNCTCGAYG